MCSMPCSHVLPSIFVDQESIGDRSAGGRPERMCGWFSAPACPTFVHQLHGDYYEHARTGAAPVLEPSVACMCHGLGRNIAGSAATAVSGQVKESGVLGVVVMVRVFCAESRVKVLPWVRPVFVGRRGHRTHFFPAGALTVIYLDTVSPNPATVQISPTPTRLLCVPCWPLAHQEEISERTNDDLTFALLTNNVHSSWCDASCMTTYSNKIF